MRSGIFVNVTYGADVANVDKMQDQTSNEKVCGASQTRESPGESQPQGSLEVINRVLLFTQNGSSKRDMDVVQGLVDEEAGVQIKTHSQEIGRFLKATIRKWSCSPQCLGLGSLCHSSFPAVSWSQLSAPQFPAPALSPVP